MGFAMQELSGELMKMNVKLIAAATICAVMAPSWSAVATAEETPSLKRDVETVLAGESYGDAALAEATGYPNPILVMDWADRLDLSAPQRAAIARIRDRMLADVREIAPDLIRAQTDLEAMFRSGRASEGRVQILTMKLADLEGRIRFIHLQARLKLRFEMTRDQLATYHRIKAGEG